MRLFALSFLALFAASAVFTPALAEKRVAFVVGIKDYPHLRVKNKDGTEQLIGQLMTPLKDVDAMQRSLNSLRFDHVTIAKNVTRQEFLTKFEEFKRKIEPNDTAFFFYAGHGVGLHGGNYLLPGDFPADAAKNEQLIRDLAIPEISIIAGMQSRSAKTMIIVLDSCRDNPIEAVAAQQSLADGKPVTRALPAMLSRGLTVNPVISDNVYAIYSAGFGQTALDRLNSDGVEPKNSVFTRVFSEKIKQRGRSLNQIMDEEVKQEVFTLAQTLVDPDGTPHRQTPVTLNQMREPIYLAGLPPRIPETKFSPPPADEQMWALIQNSKVSELFEDFRSRFPTSPYAREALAKATELKRKPDICSAAEAHWKGAEAIGSKDAFKEHLVRFGTCAFAGLAKLKLEATERAERERPPIFASGNVWDHNGSRLKMLEKGGLQTFEYVEPRQGLVEVGVQPGTVAFRGKNNGNVYEGTAYVFSRTCGSVGFRVTGEESFDRRNIVMKGRRPYVNPQTCEIVSTQDATLNFRLLE